jgi:cell division protein FtsX
MRTLAAVLGAIIAVAVVAGILSFIAAYILMYLWNVVIPYFGGKELTYWVAYAGYWLLIVVGGIIRGGVSVNNKS